MRAKVKAQIVKEIQNQLPHLWIEHYPIDGVILILNSSFEHGITVTDTCLNLGGDKVVMYINEIMQLKN